MTDTERSTWYIAFETRRQQYLSEYYDLYRRICHQPNHTKYP